MKWFHCTGHLLTMVLMQPVEATCIRYKAMLEPRSRLRCYLTMRVTKRSQQLNNPWFLLSHIVCLSSYPNLVTHFPAWSIN